MHADDTIDLAEIRRRLRTLGARPSRSAEEARARELREIDAMPVEDRILLALRLGARDRTLQARDASRDGASGGKGTVTP